MSDVEIKPDDRRAIIKDNYERTVKTANYLLVAQSAGFVGCLSAIKDYKAVSPHYNGLGHFIALFGFGLILAIVYFAIVTFLTMKAAEKTKINVTQGGSRVADVFIIAAFLVAFVSLVLFIGAVVWIIVRFWSL